MRLVAFVTYLASWFVFAAVALWQTFTKVRQPASPVRLHPSLVIGTLLQFAGALAVTLAMSREAPLRPATLPLLLVMVLAPLAAILFLWTLRSQHPGLVTTGAYSVVRHPLYLTFLLMLLATGLLVATPLKLALALGLYIAGSEVRIAAEERELAASYPDYAAYQQRVRARYLPGLH
ncbi:MAG: hypothetical protein K2X03_12245 [Bryobacteraceae bacterium]|nr:hypothetical protein [Bryobacteraceae bacterium]